MNHVHPAAWGPPGRSLGTASSALYNQTVPGPGPKQAGTSVSWFWVALWPRAASYSGYSGWADRDLCPGEAS